MWLRPPGGTECLTLTKGGSCAEEQGVGEGGNNDGSGDVEKASFASAMLLLLLLLWLVMMLPVLLSL